ncbi:transcriptional regulator [Alsobacter metallidurans]|uniref:Transcriptional regulator n=1 Tax=Alsobacter metallidurans TaxID=340221 RepID=A0A917MI04_9HYPH|nr:LysR family transcriptional regulator [Alsobacter metallidurans]GGH20824.1 transcriptional regulator [Alsobacter metallidurans]
MRVDFLGLEAFLSIADRGSFNLAAAHLNLSQTALSHRMKKLEDDLGLKLLARTTRQVSLTPAGQDLLPKARRLMEEIAISFAELRRQGKDRQERLAVGCLPTIAIHYLPRVLHEFQAEWPGLTVQVHDNSASEIAEHVQAGRAEFGITIVSANRWDLEIAPLLKEPFVAVCPVGHPLATEAAIDWSQLEGTPLVRISPQTGNRALIDDALGSRREQMTWRYECQHVATAVSLVAEGLGIAILPRLSIEGTDAPGVRAVTLRNPGISRTLGVISKKGLPLSPAASALVALIKRRLKAEGRRSAD